jgi:hypothetical protein
MQAELLVRKDVQKTLIMEVSCQAMKEGGCVIVLQNSWNFTCCRQLIVSNFSILKSVPFAVAGSFTVTAWIWNVTMYTTDPR